MNSFLTLFSSYSVFVHKHKPCEVEENSNPAILEMGSGHMTKDLGRSSVFIQRLSSALLIDDFQKPIYTTDRNILRFCSLKLHFLFSVRFLPPWLTYREKSLLFSGDQTEALHLCDLLENASVADLEKVHREFRQRLFFLSEHEFGSLLLMKFCARISDLNLEEPIIQLLADHIADLERMKMTLLNGIG